AVRAGRSCRAYSTVWGAPPTAPDTDGATLECRSADDLWPGDNARRTAMVILPRLCGVVVWGCSGNTRLSAFTE
ncbi:hypothetical protein ABTO93_19725, partial [Acinetobacter baumannii]